VTTEQRRLAAILIADVVGFSKLIGSDEAGTLTQPTVKALVTQCSESAAGWIPEIGSFGSRACFGSSVMPSAC